MTLFAAVTFRLTPSTYILLSMKYSKWIGLLSVITVIIACFTTWAYVPSAQLQIGGIFSNGKQNFGKPGLMNIICSAVAAIWFLLPQVWAKRANIFFCGFNIAWAVRNYILLSRCYSGECPVKKTGLYLLVVFSGVMLLMSFMPDVEIKDESNPPQKAV
jgi:hypothetical protein